MLRSKSLTIVLSLLIAITLWAYVIAFENPPTTERVTGVPVQLFNEGALNQDGYAILEGDNVTVEVVVSGTRSDISRYRDQIIATASVFGFRNGEHYLTVEVLPPGQLVCIEVKPVKIRVIIDSLVSAYKPVNLFFTGEEEPDTEPGKISIQPEQIEVVGPKTLVESVSYVGVEVPLSQIKREENEIYAQASAYDINGDTVPRVKLSSDTVSVKATLYNVKEVPLFVEIVGAIDERYEMTQCEVPETIMIRGSRDALLEIESVEAQPIDISEVENTSELPVIPILPDGVEVASGSYNIHVSIGIKGISSISFTYDSNEIEIRGAGEGLKAYINTPTINLRVAGREAILDSAEKKDFILYVDIEGLEEGVHIAAVAAEHDKALNSLEIIPGEVHITVSEDL